MLTRKSKKIKFPKSDVHKLIDWASQQPYFSYINGNDFNGIYGSFPRMIFVGRQDYVESSEASFQKLKMLIERNDSWLFGYFSYDLKNEIEDLYSKNPATIPAKNLAFYVPQTILTIYEHEIEIDSILDPDTVYKDITIQAAAGHAANDIGQLTCNTSKRQYIERVNKIKSAIVEGEFYEMNYCIEFSCSANYFSPARCYDHLNEVSPMPFSALMRTDNIYVICASPERFLKKAGDKIISQPIKGTTRRSFDSTEDELLKQTLRTSEKERAENMMIVDLVRNDLAKSAIAGTVVVDELFGIYTFKKVHQMISTVSAKANPTVDEVDIIRHAFPMGSMTGAPKIRVMEEIEILEHSARGIYSGALGYFSPNGDFDLNVIIRSLVYDAATKRLSFHVGSAITYDSDPEYEYNECLLKAEALLEVLS